MKKFMATLLMLGMVFSTASCTNNATSQLTKATSTEVTPTVDNSKSSNISQLFESSTSKIEVKERKIAPRDYYSNPENAETATLLIYMCGSDLESIAAFATDDILEMLDADISDNLNIILETGGAEKWCNDMIGTNNTRYQLVNDGLILIDDTLGVHDMGNPQTLSNFIDYGVSNYPADRYMLLLWDHGGGTLGGFAADERFDDYEEMTIDKIGDALSSSKVRFDFIGFDACLMATVETAFVLEQYADYLISSQLTEPNQGWNYAGWITALSNEPNISTPDLGKIIIDDYISACFEYDPYRKTTLSLMDLTKLRPVIDALDVFIESAQKALIEEDFGTIAKVRADLSLPYASVNANSRTIADDYDQIDIVSLAEKLSSYAGSKELISAIKNCIVYENHSNEVSDRNGMNFYFPYTDIYLFQDVYPLYNNIGFSDKYVEFISSFISIMIGGQNPDTNELDAPMVPMAPNTLPSSDKKNSRYNNWWSNAEWFDEALFSYYNQGYYEKYKYIYRDGELKIQEKNGNYIVKLSDEDRHLINNIQVTVFHDYGTGYTHLGYDDFYTLDNNGNLLINFDKQWLTLNNKIVPFYFENEEYYSDDTWSISGYVPAFINDEYAEIIVVWDTKNPSGYVAGYRAVYDSFVSSKGLFKLKTGDTIKFLFNLYTYDLDYLESTYFNDEIRYNGSLKVSYEDIDYGNYLVYYHIVDIYGNVHTTGAVNLSNPRP